MSRLDSITDIVKIWHKRTHDTQCGLSLELSQRTAKNSASELFSGQIARSRKLLRPLELLAKTKIAKTLIDV